MDVEVDYAGQVSFFLYYIYHRGEAWCNRHLCLEGEMVELRLINRSIFPGLL